MKKLKKYIRPEDMSCDSALSIMMEEDGDIIVSIVRNDLIADEVQFCIEGGRSRNTRKALIALADAIEKDNVELPIRRDETNN